MEIKTKVDSVLIGRVLAGLIILLGLIVAIWTGADAQRDSFRIFLTEMITPLSFGFVLIMLSEGLKCLRSAEEEENGDEEEETP